MCKCGKCGILYASSPLFCLSPLPFGPPPFSPPFPRRLFIKNRHLSDHYLAQTIGGGPTPAAWTQVVQLQTHLYQLFERVAGGLPRSHLAHEVRHSYALMREMLDEAQQGAYEVLAHGEGFMHAYTVRGEGMEWGAGGGRGERGR